MFITGRRQKELDEAVKAIGGTVSGVQGDVAKLPDLDRLYETVSKVKGRIDIVFANAGVAEFVSFGAVSEEHFDKLFNINVRRALFTVQKALREVGISSANQAVARCAFVGTNSTDEPITSGLPLNRSERESGYASREQRDASDACADVRQNEEPRNHSHAA